MYTIFFLLLKIEDDIINAQTTLNQQQIMTELRIMKENDLATLQRSDKANTKYINETRAVVNTFKWLVGLIGIGNIIMLAKILS